MAPAAKPREFGLPDQPDPVSAGTHDVGWWQAFYQELIEYEESALQRMRELEAKASPAVRAEVWQSNIEPMEDLIKDLRTRLSEWESRRRKEQGARVD
jgi:hypothetical protein